MKKYPRVHDAILSTDLEHFKREIEKVKDINEKIILDNKIYTRHIIEVVRYVSHDMYSNETKMGKLIEMVAILLKKGADINALNHHGENALFLCFGMKRVDNTMSKYLIENGSNVNQVNCVGVTPFFFSLRDLFYKKNPVFQLMIEYGADINYNPKTGNDPITFILCEMNRNIRYSTYIDIKEHAGFLGIKYLLNYGSITNTVDLNAALRFGGSEIYLEVLKVLMQYGFNLNRVDILIDFILDIFVTDNLQYVNEIVRLFIDNGVDIHGISASGANILSIVLGVESAYPFTIFKYDDSTTLVEFLVDSGCGFQINRYVDTMKMKLLNELNRCNSDRIIEFWLAISLDHAEIISNRKKNFFERNPNVENS